MTHQFLFKPGTWLGEGKISFKESKETIPFYTRWVIDSSGSCTQEVEMQDVEETTRNQFLLTHIDPSKFTIQIENIHIGKAIGEGIITPDSIKWEYQNQNGYQGFEIYHLKTPEEYTFNAEYGTEGQFRTLIQGRIWKKYE